MATFRGSLTTTDREDDPALTSFLGLLEKDMQAHPGRIRSLAKEAISRGARVTKRVKVSDADRLPNDVSFSNRKLKNAGNDPAADER